MSGKTQARQIWQWTFFRGSKSIKNRYRFCTIWLVGLEIDKDFRQSYWLALQFQVQPNRIFTVGVPQASHGKTSASANSNTLSLELQISYCFRQLVNTELENRPSSHFTKHSSPAWGKKLSSSKELARNLYTVWHKVLENTKQANSSSLSTYFMISVTDANLLTHVNMP